MLVIELENFLDKANSGDPEGDYSELPDAVVVGDVKQEPRLSEIRALLAKPDISVVVNLLAIDPEERPRFLARFLPDIAKLRAETGRPHWIVLDEAHHCLPAKWDHAPVTLPRELPAAIAVTVHPEEVSRDFLDLVSMMVGITVEFRSAVDSQRATAQFMDSGAPRRSPRPPCREAGTLSSHCLRRLPPYEPLAENAMKGKK